MTSKSILLGIAITYWIGLMSLTLLDGSVQSVDAAILVTSVTTALTVAVYLLSLGGLRIIQRDRGLLSGSGGNAGTRALPLWTGLLIVFAVTFTLVIVTALAIVTLDCAALGRCL